MNKNSKRETPHPSENDPAKKAAQEECLNWLIQGSDWLGTTITRTVEKDGWPSDIMSGTGYADAQMSYTFCHATIASKCAYENPDVNLATEKEMANAVRRTAAESASTAICAMAVAKILTDETLTQEERLKASARLCAVLVQSAIGGLTVATSEDGEICTTVQMKLNEKADEADPVVSAVLSMLRDIGVQFPSSVCTLSDLNDALTRLVKEREEADREPPEG